MAPKLRGFEALIRWVKPDGELLLPGAFAKKFDAVFFKPEHRDTRQSMRQAVLDALKSFDRLNPNSHRAF